MTVSPYLTLNKRSETQARQDRIDRICREIVATTPDSAKWFANGKTLLDGTPLGAWIPAHVLFRWNSPKVWP